MFILLCSPHSFLLIELLTTSLILISFFFFSRIVTEKPHQGSVNKLLHCIVLKKRLEDMFYLFAYEVNDLSHLVVLIIFETINVLMTV